MKEWVTAVSIIAIVISLSDFILPNGKTQKTVRCVFGFCCILIMSYPIVKLANGKFQFQNLESEYEYQQSYLDFIANQLEDEIAKNCNKLLQKNDISATKIEVFVDSNQSVASAITIYGITEEKKDTVRTLICETYSIREENVYFEDYTE